MFRGFHFISSGIDCDGRMANAIRTGVNVLDFRHLPITVYNIVTRIQYIVYGSYRQSQLIQKKSRFCSFLLFYALFTNKICQHFIFNTEYTKAEYG